MATRKARRGHQIFIHLRFIISWEHRAKTSFSCGDRADAVHLDTTNHYAQARLKMKRKALEQVDSKLRPTRPPHWKRDADPLAWLDSL